LALKEAKKAKLSSDVKIAGRDVIASYKILVSLVLVPTVWFIEYIYVLIVYGWKVAAFFIFFLPFVSYASVRMMEEGLTVWRSSIPLLLSLFESSYYNQITKLRQQREELQTLVRDSVENLGPKLGAEFWKHRIVEPQQLAEESPENEQSTYLKLTGRKQYKKKKEEFQLDERIFDDLPFLNS